MKYLVIDTETLSLTNPYIYDLSYIIYNDETGELEKENCLPIKNVLNNKMAFKSAYFYSKNKNYYVGKKSYTFKKAIKILLNDIKNENEIILCGYNLKFDIRAIDYTYRNLYYNMNKKLSAFLYQKNTLDILNKCKDIVDKQGLEDFERHNKLIPTNKNVSYTAEYIYRYLFNQIEYNELHCALQDCKDELKIMLECDYRVKTLNQINKDYETYKRINAIKNLKSRI